MEIPLHTNIHQSQPENLYCTTNKKYYLLPLLWTWFLWCSHVMPSAKGGLVHMCGICDIYGMLHFSRHDSDTDRTFLVMTFRFCRWSPKNLLISTWLSSHKESLVNQFVWNWDQHLVSNPTNSSQLKRTTDRKLPQRLTICYWHGLWVWTMKSQLMKILWKLWRKQIWNYSLNKCCCQNAAEGKF